MKSANSQLSAQQLSEKREFGPEVHPAPQRGPRCTHARTEILHGDAAVQAIRRCALIGHAQSEMQP
jgi:hypothetical protein